MEHTEGRQWPLALAAELRAERHALGFTQDQVVEMTGLSKSAIGRIEKGKRDATIAQITSLCDAYGIPPSVLLARVESRRSGAVTPHPVEAEPEEPAIEQARHKRRSGD